MLSIVLAAASALVWGAADFCGGKASQRGSALAVTVVSQLLGFPVFVACLLLVPGAPQPSDLAWGAAAGVAGLAGIVLLYRGLSTGAMSVVAPITAVTAALVPMAVGLVMERPPGHLALAGAVCAVVAIALVSVGPTGTGGVTARAVGLALAAGALFGVFFALLAQTHEDSGMWPLAGVRLASLPLGLALMAIRRVPVRVPRSTLWWVAAAGAGDIGANAFYLVAAREGLLSLVAPIASLYPVSTVLLAVAVNRERIRPVQLAGLGLAATALVLTAV